MLALGEAGGVGVTAPVPIDLLVRPAKLFDGLELVAGHVTPVYYHRRRPPMGYCVCTGTASRDSFVSWCGLNYPVILLS